MTDNLGLRRQPKPMFSLLRNNRGEVGVEQETEEQETETEVPAGKWFDGLGEDLKNNPSITKFKDAGDLAKSYVELQKMIGKEKIVVPTDKSTPEEWNAFYEKIGRPQDITGYETPELEIPEEIKMRPETLEVFKAKAHELGLNKKQFTELFALQAEMNQKAYNQQLEEIQKLKETTETELRKEWGAAYDKKVDNAQKVINTFFKDKGLHKAFGVLANDKGFVSAMSDIAERLGEDVIAGKARTTMTPAEARSELNAMMGDSNSPLFNELHPEHDAAVERSTELQKLIEAANG